MCDEVFVKNFGRGEKWVLGTIQEVRGSVDYVVRLCDDRMVHRHIDQVVRRTAEVIQVSDEAVPIAGVPELSNMETMEPRVVELEERQSPSSVAEPSGAEGESSERVVVATEIGETPVVNTQSSPGVQTQFSRPMVPRDVKKELQPRATSTRVRKRPAYLVDYE